ncbi:MAG: cytochrome d ubiquinol oxidase subunit II, partial [Gemmatimonadaceae bacterium]
PVLLGVIVGAIASGAVGNAQSKLAMGNAQAMLATANAQQALDSVRPSFAEIFVTPWLDFFPLAVGLLALALFAFLAAVYLTVAARDEALREDFRTRALAAAGAAFITAAAALLVAHVHAPTVGRGLVETMPALLLQGATAIAALTAIFALWTRRWQLARIAAAAQVSLVLWGWVLVQYPFIVPPIATLRNAAAPPVTLELLLSALALGAIVLLPSLWYLLRTFTDDA